MERRSLPTSDRNTMKSVLGHLIGILVGVAIALSNVLPHVDKAFDLGYKAGLAAEKPTVRELILNEPKYVSQLCKNWWFDMTIKDRKL